MNLYNGGKDNLRNDIIGSEINLAKSQSDITKINLLSDVRSHYWNSVYQNEVTEILNLALSSNDKNLTAAKKKIRAGLSTSTDALDFEQFKLQVMQLFERSKVTAENLKAKLQATLGLEISDLQLKDQSVPHLHHDVLLATDLKLDQHREIQLLEAEKSRLKNEQKIQKRWWTPELNLYSSFAHFTQKERDYPSKADRDDKTVGLVLKMNLFDGGEAYNQAKSSALKTQGLEYYQEQKRKELQVTFENAKRTLKLTHDLVHFAEENVSKTQTYLNRILDEYQRGIKNSPDVLQASSRLVESKIKFAELRRDYQLARVECLSVLGE
ncbi:MAG: TolC family protein [Bacteriovoracaceae bacterium]|nr:TolC family protein [Bacteriovoracaceae bacterium]